MRSPIQGPLGKQRALLVLRAQAQRWLEAYKADVLDRGLGFTPDDVTALQTAKAANPGPDADDVSLGHTPQDWKAAMDGWTARIEDDVVIATMYGQLFSQVGDLPLRTPHA